MNKTHQEQRKELWMQVAAAYVRAGNSIDSAGAARWANVVVADFDKAFPARDEHVSRMPTEHDRLTIALSTCKNDYNFMINLIENYSTDKEQTIKDCLERMKFRQPLFDVAMPKGGL